MPLTASPAPENDALATSRALDWFVVAATFVWSGIVFTALYGTQKPFTPAVASRLLTLAADLSVAAAIVGGAAGLGLRLIGRLPLPGISRAERLGLGTLLGMGTLSLLWLTLGLVGLARRSVGLAVTVVLLAAAIPILRQWLRNKPPGLYALPRPLRGYLIVMLGLSLLHTLVPATDWDGLSYHLAAPARWAALGRIGWIGAEGPFYYPHLLEVLFLPAMLLRSDSAARLLHWTFYPLVLWLVGDLTHRFFPGVPPWRAIAVAASIPMLAQLAGWAYTDVALGAFTLAALLALLASVQHGGGWRVLAGLFAGFALGLKYQAFIVPLSLLVLLASWHRREPARALRHIVVVGTVASLVWLPWLLRNFWLTGDPVYPFGSGGRGWDAFHTIAFAAVGTGFGLDPARLLALPWLLTSGLGGISVYDGRSGPLFLALLPLTLWFLARGRGAIAERRVLGALLTMAALHGLLWTIGVINSAATSQSRFLLAVFLLLSPVLAWGWELLVPLTSAHFRPAGLLNLLVGFALALTALQATVETAAVAPATAILGIESREQYLANQLGSFWAATERLNQLPEGSRILLLWEPRSYYLQQPVDPDIILDEFAHRLWLTGGNVSALMHSLRSEGITHLLVFWAGVDFLQSQDPSPLSAGLRTDLTGFLTGYTREVWWAPDGSYAIYELSAP